MQDIDKGSGMKNGGLNNDIREKFLQTSVVPVSADEVSRISGAANATREKFASSFPAFGYNAGSVKFLSDSIDTERLTFREFDKDRLANLYGAFLGHTILTLHPQGRWVRYDGDLAILFDHGGRKRLVFPISRLCKQIEQGNSASMYPFFLTVAEFLASTP